MKSIFWRQLLLIAGLIIFSFLLLAGTIIPLTYQYTMAEKRESMEANADFIARLTSTYWGGLNMHNVQNADYRIQISFAAMMADATIFICRADGMILFSTDGTLGDSYAGASVPQTVSAAVLQGGAFGEVGTLGGLLPERHYVVGAPIGFFRDQTAVTGMVFIAARTEALTTVWRAVTSITARSMCGALLIAFFSTYCISVRQTRPLKEMAFAAELFGRGRFDTRVSDYGRRDEVGALARAFNSMAESLAQAEARRRDFIANISHELKTPMTTISGFTDGILDGTIPRERVEESLKTISAESHRLARLVKRMLELSRLQDMAQAPPPQGRFDIAETMRRVLLSLETRINERGLDVEAEIPDDPIPVLGEQDSILQVGYNLIDNAIKFSPPGGKIGVSVIKKERKVLVAVRNHAEDIPPGELTRIFERFHKTDRSRGLDREGVGLGLYIVKTILDTHREDITVTSENGLTVFTFTLTAAD